MIDKEQLCKKIEEIYPDIGTCGIDVDVEYDDNNERWTVYLQKGHQKQKTFLEQGDAEMCLQGKQCVSLGVEVAQLRDTVERK